MAVLTLNQRRQNNFKKSFFLIEGGFYFFQGIFASGLQVFFTFYMTQVFDLDITIIAAITAMTGVPMYLKMFTGLLSDKVPIGKFGRRKPYILLGGIAFVIAFAFLIGLSKFSSLWVFAFILCNVAFVIVDGTADALTVDITPDEYTTKMQGIANAGRYAGMAVGIIIGSFLSEIIGWVPVIVILGVAAILQAGAAMLFREIETVSEKTNELSFAQSFKLGFGNKGAILGLFFSVLFMGSFGVTYIINPVLMENVSTNVYGIANLVGYIVVALSAYFTGIVVNKFGGVTNKIIFILYGLIWLFMVPWLFVLGNWDNTVAVILAQTCMGVSRGIVTVVTYSVLMRLCSEALEGFMFAIFTSLMNVGQLALTPNIVAYFGNTLGWGMISALFVMMPIMLIGVLLVPGINKSIAQKAARREKIENKVV